MSQAGVKVVPFLSDSLPLFLSCPCENGLDLHENDQTGETKNPVNGCL